MDGVTTADVEVCRLEGGECKAEMSTSDDKSLLIESVEEEAKGSRSTLSGMMSDGTRSRRPLSSLAHTPSPKLMKEGLVSTPPDSATVATTPGSKRSLAFPCEQSHPSPTIESPPCSCCFEAMGRSTTPYAVREGGRSSPCPVMEGGRSSPYPVREEGRNTPYLGRTTPLTPRTPREKALGSLPSTPGEKRAGKTSPTSPREKGKTSSPSTPRDEEKTGSSAPGENGKTTPSTPREKVRRSSKSKRKSKHGGEGGSDSPRRKCAERKRGLSTSSSDDPKSSRSRTESGGSEVAEAFDLPPLEDQPQSPARASMGGDVQCFKALGIRSPELNASESTLVADQDNVMAAEAGGGEGKKEVSRVVFDIQSLTSPTETSSPISKEKRSKKSREGKKRGGGGGEEEERRKSKKKKRKRGQSSTSSSEDPKSSRSRTESVGSEGTSHDVPVEEEEEDFPSPTLDPSSPVVAAAESSSWLPQTPVGVDGVGLQLPLQIAGPAGVMAGPPVPGPAGVPVAGPAGLRPTVAGAGQPVPGPAGAPVAGPAGWRPTVGGAGPPVPGPAGVPLAGPAGLRPMVAGAGQPVPGPAGVRPMMTGATGAGPPMPGPAGVRPGAAGPAGTVVSPARLECRVCITDYDDGTFDFSEC